jgi:hypothetical protein
MALISVNPVDLAHLIRERRECGGDRYDEVWDGVYLMSPLADRDQAPRTEVSQAEGNLCWLA